MKKQTALWCLSLLLMMGACTTSSSRKTAGEWAKVPGSTKKYRTARIRRYCL